MSIFFIKKIKNLTLNFGPQHPAAHGVLRLLLELNGEVIKNVETHIGLLHRGTEKLIEYKTYLQALPYFDRLDYVSAMAQELTFSVAVENLLNIRVDLYSKFIRILFLELTRILNHLLALTTHAMDVGALTPFLWFFEEREKILEFYERVSGARFHANFIRPGGLSNPIPEIILNDILEFSNNFYYRISELEDMLSNNRIWKQRLVDVGIVNFKAALDYGFSGVMLRGSGLYWDLRLLDAHLGYNFFSFHVPVGVKGDCFDRYLIRIFELRSSNNIIKQVLSLLDRLDFKKPKNFLQKNSKAFLKFSMESLIEHFKFFSENYKIQKEETFTVIEAPKGEFGIYIESNGTSKPTRCRIRAPGFFHLQSINEMSKNSLLADIVTIIGTQDIVLGEVDR